jgi:two-component system, OmpR family, phosphate regulon sensor histidine kinase PhoR
MNAKSFKIIFALLSFSLLFILLIQAFWIRSFYQQKAEDFNTNVNQSFEKIAAQLKERENLQLIKESVALKPLENKPEQISKPIKKIAPNKSKKRLPSITTRINQINNNDSVYQALNGIRIYTSTVDSFKHTVINLSKDGKGKSIRIRTKKNAPVATDLADNGIKKYNVFTNKDTQFIITNAETHLIDHVNFDSLIKLRLGDFSFQESGVVNTFDIKSKPETKKPAPPNKKQEINQLLGKIVSEIKFIDASTIDKIEKDTLNRLIKNTLAAKGITTPFEFLLKKKNNNKDTVLLASSAFNTKQVPFEADMSLDKIFKSHHILQLQFPNKNEYVFANIKNALLLSILFSVLIMAAFYYAIRLILQQKKISEIKNDFINNMTHELKTPIATISLAVDSINNPLIKNDETKFKTYTNILKEENNKLNNHVERVLQMAALEKNELQLNKKTIDITSLLHKAIDAYKLQIQKQNAEILFKTKNENYYSHADEFHLLTAFTNLIDNALKYASEHCKIIISIEKIEEAINIHIRDNGIGIDTALHQKIFEKFYRVSSGNLHDTKGFGLGLSYVKSIIEAHEGQINLESEKGKGSTFIIKLKANAH